MLIYTFLVFLLFWLIGGVLTLPGIAALVLGIGMAIDSNIIMFARIKDELYKGKSVETAFKDGSKSSFSAIIDANITTFIIALIMFYFGESSIKGFATMLMITVVVTMFTMVFLTRMIMKLYVSGGYFSDKTNLFISVKKEDIPNVQKGEKVKKEPFSKVNFFKYSKYFIILSAILILAGGIVIGTKGLHLGIDYKSGTSITIVSDKDITENNIKDDLKAYNLEITNFEKTKGEVAVRVDEALSGKQVKELNKKLESKYDAKVNIGVVSNVVQRELVKNAILAVIISLFGIIIYISLRFKFSYAIGGIVAILHDVAIMFAFFAFTRLEVSSMFIAAVLAIIGYSINDTIVLFDRFREELAKIEDKKMTKEKLVETCNKAIQVTFNRTLFTSITTLLPILALIFLGTNDILTFNMAMLVGLIAGTYSSIMIAGTIFIALEKRSIGKPKKKKIVYTDEFEERKIKGVNC